MDIEAVLRALAAASVDFILVGGGAATVHGSARLTNDVDVVYRRDADNLARIASALAPFDPYLRGAPRGLPFRLDIETLRKGLNFTLTTAIGDLDLLGEITGGGGFEQLAEHTIRVDVFGLSILCLDLPKLIEVKRAAGRPKDLEAIAELELLLERRAQD
jgi:predicted nucleotidyltransferase